MSKMAKFIRRFYVLIIIGIFYAPIIFATVFSFNKQGSKGDLDFKNWNGFTWDSWKEITTVDKSSALLNSLILGIIVSFIVAFLSLVTTFAIWKQKKRAYKAIVDGTSNVPLINPDVITAVSLAIVFGAMFGTLTLDNDGMWRAIISHSVMILPYGLIIMYPRSEKFSPSLLEASKDLGYGPVKTWFKTYFRFMLPITIAVIGISLTLSFDDFILTRTTSNVTTIGTKLYEGTFKGWALALGGILMLVSVAGAGIYSVVKGRKHA